MSEPVNLNKARKARQRVDAKRRADQNAVAFGRTKAQKSAEKLRADKAAAQIDAHRRDPE